MQNILGLRKQRTSFSCGIHGGREAPLKRGATRRRSGNAWSTKSGSNDNMTYSGVREYPQPWPSKAMPHKVAPTHILPSTSSTCHEYGLPCCQCDHPLIPPQWATLQPLPPLTNPVQSLVGTLVRCRCVWIMFCDFGSVCGKGEGALELSRVVNVRRPKPDACL